jgi:hypothetical protein
VLSETGFFMVVKRRPESSLVRVSFVLARSMCADWFTPQYPACNPAWHNFCGQLIGEPGFRAGVNQGRPEHLE